MHPISWVVFGAVAAAMVLIGISFADQAPMVAGGWLAVCHIAQRYVAAAPWVGH